MDVREAAREAARREGMTVREWLGQVIAHYAGVLGVDPDDLSEDERLDAVAGELHHLNARSAQYGARPRPRMPRAASLAPHRQDVGRSYDDETTLLDRAAARFEDDDNFESLSDRLDELEAELSPQPAQNAMQPIRGALARLEARLDAMAAPAGQTAPHESGEARAVAQRHAAQFERVEPKANALFSGAGAATLGRGSEPIERNSARSSLGDAIAEITRRQQALEVPGAGRDRAEAPSSSLKARFGFGRQRLERTGTEGPRAAADIGGVSLASLHDDVAALASKVDDIRRAQAEHSALPPPNCNLDKLRSEIASMSDALRDVGRRGSTAPLEAAIRNLSRQVENSRDDGIREGVLRPIEQLIGDLRLALAESDPRMTIRGLEGEIKKLGSKIDGFRKCNFDMSALVAIDDRTREIRDLLSAAAARTSPVDKIESQVEELSQRLDRLRNGAAQYEDGDLQAVTEELRALTGDSGRTSLSKIESQLEAIAARVEEAITEARDESRYTALANRIDDVHHELAERIGQGMPQADTHALEDLVHDLAQRIEEARAPQADSQAIEALQRQVSAFAAQLDRASSGLPALSSLEHSISDLFAELERTREVSSAAAEQAARSIIEETLAKTPADADKSQILRDLVELRNMQDEAGRRTLSTLNAVHETLEKVVDRLATVETEITDARKPPAPELLASGPAPNFAPAPGRETPHGQHAFNEEEDVPPLVASRDEPIGEIPRPAPEPQARNRTKPQAPADHLDDFLIEPGRGFPGRRDQATGERVDRRPGASESPEPRDAASGRAGFIAAARRAAQAAQMESAAAMGHAPNRNSGALAEAGGSGLMEQTRNFINQHRRPVVLSIAALVLAVGAYAVLRTVGHGPTLDHSLSGTRPAPVGQAAPAPGGSRKLPAKAPRSAVPDPAASNAHAPANKSARQAIPGSDPIVTGSIAHKPKASAPHVSVAALEREAKAGNAKAQYLLASDYAEGHGRTRDLKAAAHWFEKAAAHGLAPAQYRLGSLYEKGLGVHRNLHHALAWYRRAASAGNIRAMHNLGVLIAEGGANGKPDYAAAARWFHKAAEFGVHDSEYNLAILLARGLGVRQNLVASYTWFAIAAKKGDADAAQKRDDVGARLSRANLATAKATAAAFHPKTPDPAANEVTPPATSHTPTARAHKIDGAKLSRL